MKRFHIRILQRPKLDCSYFNPIRDEIILVEKEDVEERIVEIITHETIHLLISRFFPDEDISYKMDAYVYWKGNRLLYRVGRNGRWHRKE